MRHHNDESCSNIAVLSHFLTHSINISISYEGTVSLRHVQTLQSSVIFSHFPLLYPSLTKAQFLSVMFKHCSLLSFSHIFHYYIHLLRRHSFSPSCSNITVFSHFLTFSIIISISNEGTVSLRHVQTLQSSLIFSHFPLLYPSLTKAQFLSVMFKHCSLLSFSHTFH